MKKFMIGFGMLGFHKQVAVAGCYVWTAAMVVFGNNPYPLTALVGIGIATAVIIIGRYRAGAAAIERGDADVS